MKNNEGSEIPNFLGQDIFDHMSVNIGQPNITPSKSESETLMVYSKQVEHGSMKIMDGGFIFNDPISVLIGFAINGTSFDSGPCHPHTEG